MTTRPETLDSYLSGRWQGGEGIETTLVDPVTGDELATVSAKGLDLKGALEFARREGQLGLRSLSYAERGKLVGAVADTAAFSHGVPVLAKPASATAMLAHAMVKD